jgi:anti-sigma factor RsiW
LLDGELDADARRDVGEHLAQCEVCRTELDARRALRQTLRGAFMRAASLRPEEGFLATARAAIVAEKTIIAGRDVQGPWATVPNWLSVAASLLVVTGLAWLVNSLPRAPGGPAMAAISAHAAGDHRDCALHFALTEAPISLDEAAKRYEPAYRGLREAVATSTPVEAGQVQLVEAHACVFHGRRFAHIVFRRGGRVVSLLVTPTRGDSITGTAAAVSACPTFGDLKVACTTAAGYALFVVSDLPETDNLELARLLMPSVRAHLAGV